MPFYLKLGYTSLGNWMIFPRGISLYFLQKAFEHVDLQLLRCIDVPAAPATRQSSFGALLADEQGHVLLEAENTVNTRTTAPVMPNST